MFSNFYPWFWRDAWKKRPVRPGKFQKKTVCKNSIMENYVTAYLTQETSVNTAIDILVS